MRLGVEAALAWICRMISYNQYDMKIIIHQAIIVTLSDQFQSTNNYKEKKELAQHISKSKCDPNSFSCEEITHGICMQLKLLLWLLWL